MAFNKNKKIVTTALTAAMVASAVAPVAAAKLTPAQDASKAVDGYYKLSVKTKADVSNSAKVKKAALAKVAKLGKKDAKLKASLTAKVAKKSAAINKYYQTVIVPAEAEAKAIETAKAALAAAKAYVPTADTKVEDVEKMFADGLALINKIKDAKVKEDLTKQATDLKAEVLKKIEELATPKVASVTAINGTTLQVEFNKAVNASDLYDAATGIVKTTALTVTGTASAATVSAANLKGSLNADGKVLTVTVIGGAEFLDGTYAVELLENSVKLRDDVTKFVGEHKSLVTANDVTGPSIASVTYDGSSAVVTFSEALKSEGTVSLNGVQLTSGTDYDAFVAGSKQLVIKNLVAGKANTLTLVGAKDVKGNYTSPNAISTALTLPTDNVKPTVAVSVTGTKVTFDFSEDLKGIDLDATPGTTEYAKVTLGSGTPVYLTAAAQDADDASKFTVDFNASVAGDFLNSTVKVEGFVDKAGLTGDAVTTSVSLVKDKTAPTFVSATTKDDKLIVKYNEDVKNASLAKTDLSIKFVDADGVLHSAANPTAIGTVVDSYDANGNGKIDGDEENYIVIPLTGSQFVTGTKLNAGTYTVTLATDKVTDTSVAANKASSITFNATVTGTTASSAIVELLTAAPTATPGQILATFNNVMGTSALVASNYKLGGETLPAGTTLTFFGDKKNVLITLPAGFVTANGDRTLAVANLLDTNGNTLKAGKTSVVASAVKENVAPTATKVTLVDGQNLNVDFSEVLAALPGTVSGIKVKVNGSEVALDATTPFALDATKKVVTIKASAATAFKLTDVITVEFSNANIADLAGNTVANVTLTK